MSPPGLLFGCTILLGPALHSSEIAADGEIAAADSQFSQIQTIRKSDSIARRDTSAHNIVVTAAHCVPRGNMRGLDCKAIKDRRVRLVPACSKEGQSFRNRRRCGGTPAMILLERTTSGPSSARPDRGAGRFVQRPIAVATQPLPAVSIHLVSGGVSPVLLHQAAISS